MSANGKSSELSPQQALFKEYYLKPSSDTFGNALQSALKAKYSPEYAKTITGQGNEWFSEIIRDKERLAKAEKVLDKTLSEDTSDNDSRHKTQIDVAKFVAKGMAKQKYSERTELTGKDGQDLPTPILNIMTDVQRNLSDNQSSEPQQEN